MPDRVIAIGDIHGQLAELERVHALVAEDRARTGDDLAPVVHLGDLVDRGPEGNPVGGGERLPVAVDGPHVVVAGDRPVGPELAALAAMYRILPAQALEPGQRGAETAAARRSRRQRDHGQKAYRGDQPHLP